MSNDINMRHLSLSIPAQGRCKYLEINWNDQIQLASTLEAAPGKHERGCDILNVWCKEEVKILMGGDESEDVMINGT